MACNLGASAPSQRRSATIHEGTPSACAGARHAAGDAASRAVPSFDVMGNKAITLPKHWPIARPQLASMQERLERPELRLAFAWAIQTRQHRQGIPVLPPCSWCGFLTGGYCDFCTNATALCSTCGGADAYAVATCRTCHAAPMSQWERWPFSK